MPGFLSDIAARLYHPPSGQPIQDYFTAFQRYPANNKQWWIAKYQVDEGNHKQGDFNPQLLSKFYFGNTRAPRGHFVVQAFNLDRTAVSGVTGLPIETIQERPPTISFFSGRVWYACNSTVYYSQILDDKKKAGFCYQEGDPTSEDFNTLLATDGGVIPIPECAKILKLVPMGFGMLVFGINGVWYISGTQAGFSATDITVSKLSPVGTECPNSIVEAENRIFWWSKTGIQMMAMNQGQVMYGGFDQSNISLGSIQTFFNEDIPESSKVFTKGLYDPATNIIQWFFKSVDSVDNYFFDRVLVLDLTLMAFYPWTVSSSPDRPYIIGGFSTPRLNQIKGVINIIDETGTSVVNEVSNGVIEEQFDVDVRSTFLKYLVAVPEGPVYKFGFGSFKNTDYADWAQFSPDGVGYPYLSFVETGYELLEDAMRAKQANYVFTYFEKQDENFIPDGSGDLTTDRPSSCLFQIKWDWTDSNAANRWSTKREAYRYRRNMIPNDADLTFDDGSPVVVSKHKVRGHGRAIQFRFENGSIGSGFNLLGWASTYTGNTQP